MGLQKSGDFQYGDFHSVTFNHQRPLASGYCPKVHIHCNEKTSEEGVKT